MNNDHRTKDGHRPSEGPIEEAPHVTAPLPTPGKVRRDDDQCSGALQTSKRGRQPLLPADLLLYQVLLLRRRGN